MMENTGEALLNCCKIRMSLIEARERVRLTGKDSHHDAIAQQHLDPDP